MSAPHRARQVLLRAVRGGGQPRGNGGEQHVLARQQVGQHPPQAGAVTVEVLLTPAAALVLDGRRLRGPAGRDVPVGGGAEADRLRVVPAQGEFDAGADDLQRGVVLAAGVPAVGAGRRVGEQRRQYGAAVRRGGRAGAGRRRGRRRRAG
ncbi:hypothetical protein KCH_09690 [Kitasatospora cheerisanensis KCTC 2395]|uniref:Uncharacterized protein n=1 Tax=Kitasatospora cheerisanensis KCTC 2395 TaxID=1348663 RepID=A0A066Z1A2_9ACTN|nr:hypothetical protein KCH_09690 [Kitasatospora cheerisanensis KCTC 2395]